MADHVATWLVRCSKCGLETRDRYFEACSVCGGQMEVFYDYEPVRAKGRDWLKGIPHSIWGYSELLPSVTERARVSLGEGDTPLLLSRRLMTESDHRVFWKNETVNPTWSHKDRYQAVAATLARELGFGGLAGTSTGNHGVAAAAYASAAGLRSLIFYPPEMSASFLYLTGVYGGQAAVTGWDARQTLLEQVLALGGWCPVDGRNPFGIEGYKTIAYEVVRDLGHAPDYFFAPVGSGKLITGVWRGFRDLVELGLISQSPRFIACQASGVDVISAPLEGGREDVPVRRGVYTVALSTKEPTTDARVLQVIRDSGGSVVTVTEGRIMATVRALGRDGLAIEPASALPPAAVELLLEEGQIEPGAVSVCLLTSSLTKTPELLPEVSGSRPWRISVNGDELLDLMKGAGLLSESAPSTEAGLEPSSNGPSSGHEARGSVPQTAAGD